MPEVLTSGIEKVAVKNVRKHVLSGLMFSLKQKQIALMLMLWKSFQEELLPTEGRLPYQ